MVLFFSLGFLLQIGDLPDPKAGDCLTEAQAQQLVGVSNPDVYKADQCKIKYPVEGKSKQKLSCGLELDTGSWTRSIKEHKKPGFFWPSSVPCSASVTDAVVDLHEFEFTSNQNQCSEKETFVATYQTETLKSKSYSAGQGELYLPSPLIVHREKFSFDGSAPKLETCSNTQMTGVYKGMGAVEMEYKLQDCEGHTLKCNVYEVGAGKNDSGETCALIKNINRCD